MHYEKWLAAMDHELNSLLDSGVYVFGEGDARVLLHRYVDDLLVVLNQRECLKLVKMQLLKRFKMGMLSG